MTAAGITRNQRASYPTTCSNANLRFQSFFTLITVQARALAASIISDLVKLPTLVSGKPARGAVGIFPGRIVVEAQHLEPRTAERSGDGFTTSPAA